MTPPLFRTAPLWAAVLLGLVLSACAGPRRLADMPAERPALFPHHSLLQIRRSVEAPSAQIASYHSRANIRIEMPDYEGSFSADVRHRKADSISVSVSVGPGVRVARALVTADSFFVYDRLKRRLMLNSTEAVLSAYAVGATPADVFVNMLGLLAPPDDPWFQVVADTSNYYLVNHDSGETYTVDPRIWRVTRYVVRDAEGQVIEDRTYSDFDLFGDQYLPRRIVLNLPHEKVHFSLYHRSLDVNPETLDLSFEIGRVSERIVFPPPPVEQGNQ